MDNEIKMDEIVCPRCNFANKAEAKFCQSCGGLIEIKVEEPQEVVEEKEEVLENTCPNCNATCQEGAKFCKSCGASLENEAKKKEEAEKKKEAEAKEKEARGERMKKAKASKPYAIVKSSIILFLSFILLACAFMPVVSYKFDEDIIENLSSTIEVELTPLENITFLFDSMKEYDEEGVKYDDLYEDYEDISGELEDIIREYRGDSYVYLSYEEKEIIVEYAKIITRLALISDAMSPTPELVFNAVVSLLYIVFAFVFFGISLFNFIKAIRGKGANIKLLNSFVCLAPFVIGFVYSILCSGYVDSTMSDAGAAMFFFILAIGGLIAERFVFAEKKIRVSQILVSAFSVLLCMIVMSTAFGLVFNVEIRGKFVDSARIRGAETSFDSSFYQGGFESNQKVRDYLYADSYNTDIEKEVNAIIKNYTAAEVKDGEADFDIGNAITLTMYRWMKDASVYMCSIYYVGAIVAILALITAWRILAGFMNEEYNNRKSAKLFSLLTIISAFVYLILNCVFIYMFNSMSDIAGTQRIFSMSLNSVVVETLLLTAIIFVLSLLLHNSKKKTETEETQVNE